MIKGSLYDWNEIFQKFNDDDLFKVLFEKGALPERRTIAEKILTDQGLIKKDAEGKYVRELVEKTYLNFTAYNLAKQSDEETIDELINRGVDKPSAIRLVRYYHGWKQRQTKKLRPWKIIALICILIFIPLSLMFDTTLLFPILLIPLFFLNVYTPSIGNFKKLSIFKVIAPQNEA